MEKTVPFIIKVEERHENCESTNYSIAYVFLLIIFVIGLHKYLGIKK